MDEQDIGWRNGWGGEDFGSEVGQMWLIFIKSPLGTHPTQHDPHGPDDPFRTINYHHLDISGHDGMDEQDIGYLEKWLVLMRVLAWK